MTHRTPARSVRLLAAAVAMLTALSLVVTTAIETPDRAEAYTTKIYRGAGNAPYVGIIGDSTLSGVRWYNTYGDFYEYNFVFDAESCRRTIAESCRGREGYAPLNGLQTLRRLDGRWGRVLVMMTGYNDPGWQFDDAVDAVVAEARRQGIDKVMWMSLRTADVSYVSPEYESDSYTFRDNNRILLQKAVQYRGYLQVSDWATHSANRSDWVTSDGVHMTYSGGFALMAFITNQLDRVTDGKTVTPPPRSGANATWTAVRRGDYGSRVVTVQRALINKGFEVVGGADGDFGAYTETAVKRFQRSRGLDDSGVVGPVTAEQLGIYEPPPPEVADPTCKISRTLRPGDRLGQVRCLKLHLASHGFEVGRYDTYYGTALVDAMKYFKAVRGGRYDGIASEWALRRLGAYSAPPPRPRCGVSVRIRPGDRLADIDCLSRVIASYGFRNRRSYSYGTTQVEGVNYLKANRGMPTNGVVTAEFLQSIGLWRERRASPPCYLSSELRRGDTDRVSCLRRHLYANGYRTGTGTAFGTFIELAIRHVESLNGLPVNGTADRAVLRVLGAWRAPSSTARVETETTDRTARVEAAETTTTEATPTVPPSTTAAPATTAVPPTTSTPTTTAAATTTVPPPTTVAPPTTTTVPPATAGADTDATDTDAATATTTDG
ncbi:MAG: peptidoglycan-binding protein [Ilumatobacteraceae bacterium]